MSPLTHTLHSLYLISEILWQNRITHTDSESTACLIMFVKGSQRQVKTVPKVQDLIKNKWNVYLSNMLTNVSLPTGMFIIRVIFPLNTMLGVSMVNAKVDQTSYNEKLETKRIECKYVYRWRQTHADEHVQAYDTPIHTASSPEIYWRWTW